VVAIVAVMVVYVKSVERPRGPSTATRPSIVDDYSYPSAAEITGTKLIAGGRRGEPARSGETVIPGLTAPEAAVRPTHPDHPPSATNTHRGEFGGLGLRQT